MGGGDPTKKGRVAELERASRTVFLPARWRPYRSQRTRRHRRQSRSKPEEAATAAGIAPRCQSAAMVGRGMKSQSRRSPLPTREAWEAGPPVPPPLRLERCRRGPSLASHTPCSALLAAAARRRPPQRAPLTASAAPDQTRSRRPLPRRPEPAAPSQAATRPSPSPTRQRRTPRRRCSRPRRRRRTSKTARTCAAAAAARRLEALALAARQVGHPLVPHPPRATGVLRRPAGVWLTRSPPRHTPSSRPAPPARAAPSGTGR